MIALRRVAARRMGTSNGEPPRRSSWPNSLPAILLSAARPNSYGARRARRIGRLSGPASGRSHGLARAAAVRASLFLAFWLMISGWAPTDLPVGLAAAAGATWVSLRFLRPSGSRVRMAALAPLAASFLRQSIVSGADVAWRALNPKSQVRPGLIACPLRLPPGDRRGAFCALSSLMPGTLPTGIDEDGSLLVHCLDVRQPVAANLAAEERLFIQAVGGE